MSTCSLVLLFIRTIRNYSKSSYDHPSPNLEIRFTWSVSPVQYLGARDRRQGHCAIKCQKWFWHRNLSVYTSCITDRL